MLRFIIFFFFSSRRRHTRLTCDWSSDVCSSDLLLLPDSGQARVLGLDVMKQTDAVRRRIGFVFGGDRGLYWRLSGLDNLRYFADLYRIPPEVTRKRIPELLGRLGLAGRERDRVELYSRGMKQRLHLAR